MRNVIKSEFLVKHFLDESKMFTQCFRVFCLRKEDADLGPKLVIESMECYMPVYIMRDQVFQSFCSLIIKRPISYHYKKLVSFTHTFMKEGSSEIVLSMLAPQGVGKFNRLR